MTGPQQRIEPRLPVALPARLHLGHATSLPAKVEDVSRNGCRVRVELGALGIHAAAGLARVVERVRDRLGRGFEVELMPQDAKLRVMAKPAVLVRMSLPDVQHGDVIDLGCLFGEPLHEEELDRIHDVLQIADADEAGRREEISWEELERSPEVPRADGPLAASPVPPRRAAVSRRLIAVPKQRLPARVIAESNDDETFECRTETLTPHAVLVRMDGIVRRLGLDGYDLATTAMAFTQRYGETVRLRIGGAAEALWEGPTAVCGFEVPPRSDGDLLVTLTFQRPLDDEAKARLGLEGL